MALLANVNQFAGETVAHIHHGRRADASLTHPCDDVTAGFGPQLALQQIFFACEIGREMGQFLQHAAVATLLSFGHLLIVDRLFALQQLESHIGGSQITRHADEVGIAGSVTVDDIFLFSLADAGDADGQTGKR